MNNPVIQRELIGLLRTPQALAMQIAAAVLAATLVLLRWPSEGRVDLSGVHSLDTFRLLAYGLLTTVILLVPVFPATSIVRERNQGTLQLLFNSPLTPAWIYFGKLAAVLGFAGLLLVLTMPSAAACYAMGGLNLGKHLLGLYGLLFLAAVEYAALALLVSSFAQSTDSAVRMAYGTVLGVAVLTLAPHQFLQGMEGDAAAAAAWIRCASPLPVVMQQLGQGDVGGQGLMLAGSLLARHVALSAAVIAVCAAWTIYRLGDRILDRPRPQGTITDDLGLGARIFRSVFFLVDPQRRSRGISLLINPVFIKEFRSRRFGRMHWMLRIVSACAVLSLLLTWLTTTGTEDWGVATIGGIMVLLQAALLVLMTPSLSSGLISAERESGGWQLLQMTPLSAFSIVTGKLASSALTLALLLCATLPGYVVMMYIEPEMKLQVIRVLFCLIWTAVFGLAVSAACSSLFARTATATIVAYSVLIVACVGTFAVWLARDAPFTHRAVETVLLVNPVAAALSVMKTPGFEGYQLVPGNWWFLAAVTSGLGVLLLARVARLTHPA